ncbi:MAG: CapA family protein [Treponemataceae bacterium]|nr:CapA family protein [Treponemataceae bacterium]
MSETPTYSSLLKKPDVKLDPSKKKTLSHSVLCFRGFQRILVFLLLFCLVSCSPVVYEIIVPTDVYNRLESDTVFKNAPFSDFFEDDIARELFSCEKYRIIVLGEANENVTASKAGNFFILARVSFQEELSEAFYGERLPEQSRLSKEISRTYLYPSIPFTEDIPEPVYDVGKVCGRDFSSFSSAGSPELLELSEIPQGNIILPVSCKGAVYLADNNEYPLYKSKLLECEFYTIPDVPRESVRNHYQAACDFSSVFFKDSVMPLYEFESFFPDVFFVAAVGDIILSRGVQETMIYARSAEPVLTDTIPILKNSDFTIGNLEGAVTARTENALKTYTFKFKKAALPYLREAGFDYLMLTNNHCYDYGEDGFKDTLESVAAAGFVTSGAGLNRQEAGQFYRTKLKGHDVSVLSFGAYPVERSGFDGKTMAAATEERAGILWESEEVLDMIRREKESGALIIVNIHGGSEYYAQPTSSQRDLYERVCDAGADVVFGSHPHVLQPVEWYKESLISWSLGNFVFPGMEDMPGATDSMIIRLGFVDGRLLYYEKYPVYIDQIVVSLK